MRLGYGEHGKVLILLYIFSGNLMGSEFPANSDITPLDLAYPGLSLPEEYTYLPDVNLASSDGAMQSLDAEIELRPLSRQFHQLSIFNLDSVTLPPADLDIFIENIETFTEFAWQPSEIVVSGVEYLEESRLLDNVSFSFNRHELNLKIYIKYQRTREKIEYSIWTLKVAYRINR